MTGRKVSEFGTTVFLSVRNQANELHSTHNLKIFILIDREILQKMTYDSQQVERTSNLTQRWLIKSLIQKNRDHEMLSQFTKLLNEGGTSSSNLEY